MERSILLVEDSEDDVLAFKWAAKKAKIENPLNIVTDGQAAIDYLSGSREYSDRTQHPLPGLLFLDLKLPYRSGWDVFAWIRENLVREDLAVVILSGSDEARDHDRAQELGAHAYLVKPASPEQIYDIVSEL